MLIYTYIHIVICTYYVCSVHLHMIGHCFAHVRVVEHCVDDILDSTVWMMVLACGMIFDICLYIYSIESGI